MWGDQAESYYDNLGKHEGISDKKMTMELERNAHTWSLIWM